MVSSWPLVVLRGRFFPAALSPMRKHGEHRQADSGKPRQGRLGPPCMTPAPIQSGFAAAALHSAAVGRQPSPRQGPGLPTWGRRHAPPATCCRPRRGFRPRQTGRAVAGLEVSFGHSCCSLHDCGSDGRPKTLSDGSPGQVRHALKSAIHRHEETGHRLRDVHPVIPEVAQRLSHRRLWRQTGVHRPLLISRSPMSSGPSIRRRLAPSSPREVKPIQAASGWQALSRPPSRSRPGLHLRRAAGPGEGHRHSPAAERKR